MEINTPPVHERGEGGCLRRREQPFRPRSPRSPRTSQQTRLRVVLWRRIVPPDHPPPLHLQVPVLPRLQQAILPEPLLLDGAQGIAQLAPEPPDLVPDL